MIELGPWVDVDLGAVLRNARRYAGIVGTRIMPMVKANGYGLGMIPVARTLEALGPWGFGVATVGEGIRLRGAGVTRPIVVFWPFNPVSLDDYLAHDLRPAIGNLEGLRTWCERSTRPFHVAFDTGMSRTGFRWHDTEIICEVRNALGNAPGFEGAFTHFSSSDSAAETTELQWTRFGEIINGLETRPPLVHAANSAAAQWGNRYSGNLCRPGIFLYGGRAGSLDPEPVATLSAVVLAVRTLRPGDPVSYGGTWHATDECEIATIGAGYADGIQRALGNRGRAWIAGHERPIVGRVTMDMTMVAMPRGTARVGDRVILFGGPVGVDEQAERAGTIAYELLTSIGPRVIRRYRGKS